MRAERDGGGQVRLDLALVDRQLVTTRSRARDLITRGFVLVDGAQVCKPSFSVRGDMDIALSTDAPGYVSRGAEKLSAALDHFAFSAAGRVALDVGASTGGFTEVLLDRGVQRVIAVDVGRDQLHERLRADARVESLEGTDIRDLDAERIGCRIDAIVIDVSFISLSKVLASVLAMAAPGCWLVALIKPQFEVGPALVGKGGVVSDEAARAAAVADIRDWLAGHAGWTVSDVMPSPIRGGGGNQEYLIGAVCDG